jgi:sec-independent protein translocase protein TatB
MFDVGFAELLLVVALAVIVLGPQEIPKVMLMLGRVMRRLQYVRYAFSQQFEDFLKENDLQDLRGEVNFEARSTETFDESAADAEEIPALEDKNGTSG